MNETQKFEFNDRVGVTSHGRRGWPCWTRSPL